MVAATPPTYDKILELDKLLRNFAISDTILAGLKADGRTGAEYIRTHALDAVRSICWVDRHETPFPLSNLNCVRYCDRTS